jgi:hypothetical protein
VELREGVIRQQQDEALADRASGTEYIYGTLGHAASAWGRVKDIPYHTSWDMRAPSYLYVENEGILGNVSVLQVKITF